MSAEFFCFASEASSKVCVLPPTSQSCDAVTEKRTSVVAEPSLMASLLIMYASREVLWYVVAMGWRNCFIRRFASGSRPPKRFAAVIMCPSTSLPWRSKTFLSSSVALDKEQSCGHKNRTSTLDVLPPWRCRIPFAPSFYFFTHKSKILGRQPSAMTNLQSFPPQD